VREYGQGRLFYTILGHNESSWTIAKFKEHLLAGIRWALKLEEGSAVPNPEVQALENTKSLVAALVAETGKKDEEVVAAVEKVTAADAGARDKPAGSLNTARSRSSCRTASRRTSRSSRRSWARSSPRSRRSNFRRK